MKGEEAVLDVSCLSEGVFYAWLSGRAFTPNFGFRPPTALTKRERGRCDAQNDSVPVNDVFLVLVNADGKVLLRDIMSCSRDSVVDDDNDNDNEDEDEDEDEEKPGGGNKGQKR
jgi:hypothetical protein